MILGTGVDMAITISRFLLAYVTIHVTSGSKIHPFKTGKILRLPRRKTGLIKKVGGLCDSTQPSDPAGPSIFTAIEEQIGLKLESARGPAEFFIIDAVERPTEN